LLYLRASMNPELTPNPKTPVVTLDYPPSKRTLVSLATYFLCNIIIFDNNLLNLPESNGSFNDYSL
jgi:hypothetical protein